MTKVELGLWRDKDRVELHIENELGVYSTVSTRSVVLVQQV